MLYKRRNSSRGGKEGYTRHQSISLGRAYSHKEFESRMKHILLLYEKMVCFCCHWKPINHVDA